MRKVETTIGARLVDKKGHLRSSSVDYSDINTLCKEAKNKGYSIQLIERASCFGFSVADAVRMTIKYPEFSYDVWCNLDPADYSDVRSESETFADYVRKTCYDTVDFECQRILSEEEHHRFNETGEYDLLINDDGLDDILLPKRDIEKEKSEFVKEIEKNNSKVKTLDVGDIYIHSFEDNEKRVWVGVMDTIRSINFRHNGSEYSAEFSMRTKVLKPNNSSNCLARTIYEEDESFEEDGFRPISEAFYLDRYIPISDDLKSKIEELN